MNEFNREWIARVWEHQRRQRRDPLRIRHVPLWRAVCATIALTLDRHDITIGTMDERREVAWENLGPYETAFGTGYAFEILIVRGCSFNITSDGTL